MANDEKSIRSDWLKLQADASTAKHYYYRFNPGVDDEGEERIRRSLWKAWPAVIFLGLYIQHEVLWYFYLGCFFLFRSLLSSEYKKFKYFIEVWTKKENKTLKSSDGDHEDCTVRISTGPSTSEQKKFETGDESKGNKDSDAANNGLNESIVLQQYNEIFTTFIQFINERWLCKPCMELATCFVPLITYLQELADVKTDMKRKHLLSLLSPSLESVLSVLDKIELEIKDFEEVKEHEKFILSLNYDVQFLDVYIKQYAQKIKDRREGIVNEERNVEIFYEGATELIPRIRDAVKAIQSVIKFRDKKADRREEFKTTKDLLAEELHLTKLYIERLQETMWDLSEFIKQAKNLEEILTKMVKKSREKSSRYPARWTGFDELVGLLVDSRRVREGRLVDSRSSRFPKGSGCLDSADKFLVKSALEFYRKLADKLTERNKAHQRIFKELSKMKPDCENSHAFSNASIRKEKIENELSFSSWLMDRKYEILWKMAHCGFACRISMCRHLFLAADISNENELTHGFQEREARTCTALGHGVVWLYKKYEECRTKIKGFVKDEDTMKREGELSITECSES